MTGVFISYASSSKAAAERIAHALAAGGHDVWRDDALPPHRPYAEVIEERLRDARAVVVVWSQAALHSQWVRAEADTARLEGKLVQVTIDGTLPPMPFNQIQCADLARWHGDLDHAEWRKVAASVDELVGAPAKPAPASGRTRRPPGPWLWAVAALVVALAVGAGLWALRDRLPFAAKPAERVAVLPFKVEGGDASLQGFADGLLDETLGALSSDHVQAVSREDGDALRGKQADQTAKRLGVGFFIDGAISKVGDQIKVRVYLNDARDHTTLWSTDFERPAAEADAMQAQIAARATDIAHWALRARSEGGGALDSATTAAFVEAVDEMSNGGPARGSTLLHEVIAKAPKFSPAYSLMAMELAPAPGQSPSDLINAKRTLANHALALDPHNGEAYLVLANILPMGAWTQRESVFNKGTVADPSFSPLFRFQSKFLAQVGRFGDSLSAAQKAAALNNMFVGGGVDPCIRLTNVGLLSEARPVCDRGDRLWPHELYNDFNQFYLDVENGREAHALVRLQNPILHEEPTLSPAAWTPFLTARASGAAAAARAAALATGAEADAGKADRRIAYIQLAMTGQVDAALAQGRAYYTRERLQDGAARDFGDSTLLFVAATGAVRQDPRFMALAAQMGLTDYWRTSGKWPDFCAKPGLPYNCPAEARRLAAAKP